MDKISISEIQKTSLILDTCILINLEKKEKLKKTLLFFKKNNVDVYFPSSYQYEWKSGRQRYDQNKSILEYCRKENLLKDINHDNASLEIYDKLKQFPLDDGELNCFSLAERYNMSIATDDKLPVLSYITWKKQKQIKDKILGPDEMLNFVYNPVACVNNSLLPVFSNFNIETIVKNGEIYDQPYSREFYKPKKWIETCNNNSIATSWFPNDDPKIQIEKCYKQIGAIFASFYACYPENKAEKYKWNLGLKIKSSTYKKYNPIFCKVEQYRNKPWFSYSPLAYNALRKYLLTCPFLNSFIRKNYSEGHFSQYYGKMNDDELAEAKKFTEKFRNLYEMFLFNISWQFK